MKKKLLITLSLLLFLEAAALAGYKIVTKLSDYKQEESASQSLRQYIDLNATAPAPTISETEAPEDLESTPSEPEEDSTAPTEEPVAYPYVDFDSLRSINEDVVAWIYIEGTNINYPVVQGEDNREYVSMMADGQLNPAGSIFMDYRNPSDFSDRHTVIYGHHMRNGSMFADILDYSDPEFYAAHSTGMIMTPEGNFQFEVIAGYVASLADPSWQLEFVTDDDFSAWLQDTMDRSTIGDTIVPSSEDRIITLSTCSYEFSDARFVLVCRVKP